MTGMRSTMARRIAVAVAVLVVLWVLFAVVFPWVDRQLNDPVLGDERVTAAAGADELAARCPPR